MMVHNKKILSIKKKKMILLKFFYLMITSCNLDTIYENVDQYEPKEKEFMILKKEIGCVLNKFETQLMIYKYDENKNCIFMNEFITMIELLKAIKNNHMVFTDSKSCFKRYSGEMSFIITSIFNNCLNNETINSFLTNIKDINSLIDIQHVEEIRKLYTVMFLENDSLINKIDYFVKNIEVTLNNYNEFEKLIKTKYCDLINIERFYHFHNQCINSPKKSITRLIMNKNMFSSYLKDQNIKSEKILNTLKEIISELEQVGVSISKIFYYFQLVKQLCENDINEKLNSQFYSNPINSKIFN